MEHSAEYIQQIEEQLRETREQLEEARDTLDAIRSGAIDALIVSSASGAQLYTLKGSDQTYRIIIEQMSEGAVTVGTDGLILYCNSRFADMTGQPLERIPASTFVDFVQEGHRTRFLSLYDWAWKRPQKAEIDLKTSDGGAIAVQVSLNAVDLEDGSVLSIILTDLSIQKTTQRILHEQNLELVKAQTIANDLNRNLESKVAERTLDLETSIREKTVVEQDLRHNQERLSRILETMAEGVQIFDMSGRSVYANPRAQRLLQMSWSADTGDYREGPNQKKLIDGTPVRETDDPVMCVMSDGTSVYDHEILVTFETGEQIYLSINAAALRNETGEIVGCISTFTDVSQRRKVIQQKDEFISVASHELKTPVTSLKAALQLMAELRDTKNMTGELLPLLITQANKSLNKLSTLIGDLLNVSKMQDGGLVLNRQSVRLQDLAREVVQHIPQDGSFLLLVDTDPLPSIQADPDKIEQVLVNFVNNAMKYAARSKTIRVTVRQKHGKALVTVTDEGPGIPERKLPYLFERYYRVDNSGTQYSGLGLGLYISAEIVRQQGGEIGVNSQVGQGSSFWFTLPLDATGAPA